LALALDPEIRPLRRLSGRKLRVLGKEKRSIALLANLLQQANGPRLSDPERAVVRSANFEA
jgi:hypothetical protein